MQTTGEHMNPTAILIDDDRVSMSPNPPIGGRRASVKYKGLLAQRGAQQVFIHLGYGADRWIDVDEVAMMPRADRSWEAIVEVKPRKGPLAFCFKDSVGNWDNNGGLNWRVGVT